MLVKGWMTKDVIKVTEETQMIKASFTMKEKRIRSLPVLDKKGRLVGIVTDRDIRDASPSKATALDVYELSYLISTITVGDIMTKDLVFAGPEETIEFAAILMLENKISSLPVINDQDKLVGIITQTDIFKALVKTAGVYSASIQIALSLEDRAGSIKEATDVVRSYGGRIVSILSTQETADAGRRNVYIRVSGVSEDKTRDLARELEEKFFFLYMVKDLLADIEKRGTRPSQ
jgi:acetoin utilization protein AcuB